MATDSAVGVTKQPKRLLDWLRRFGVGRKLAVALALAALVSGIATYVVITSKPPLGPDPNVVLLLLNLDLVLLLLLGAVVARRLVALWVERRRGMAGARLHVRFVALFSLLSVTPTIIVAVFSFLFSISASRTGSARRCVPPSSNRGRSPTPIWRSTRTSSAPTSRRWQPTSTATPRC